MDTSALIEGVSFYYTCFIEIPKFKANSVDPDQTPRCAASDLSLHCLPVSFLCDARHEWVSLELKLRP